MTDSALQSALACSPVLGDCALGAHHALFHTYRKGQIISGCINGRTMVGLVVQGGVEVYSVAMDGCEVCLTRLGRGDCFGIADLFEEARLKTVLKCTQRTKGLFFSKDELVRRMEKDPLLALRFMQLYNRKINFLIGRIAELTMHSARGKLLEYLLNACDAQDMVQITMSRDSLAKLLGVSRAALYRELASLQERDLILVQGRVVRIRNRHGMESLINNAA